MTKKDPVVLLVEDNPAEQNLARRSFNRSQIQADLRIVSDGEEALDYVFRRGEFQDPVESPRPDIILLDLNLPKINGHKVLATIKQDRKLAKIPIIILTTSRKEDDVNLSYELGCNSFLIKPVDIEGFAEVLQSVESYWLKLVVLPSIVGD